ncbi:MAG: S9 family peptidase [Fimbriimonas ginsengisoli]|uniref:prolyl oligopeptidase n=1 Tax=Fimbriimonas ginsengisoli TaxID=1005039 RepID=A0A931PWN9_FIMGI|nr:S9 family peptidase [Fimbriimonas ginsengisoli]
MKSINTLYGIPLAIAALTQGPATGDKMTYPVAKRVETVYDYAGTKVADPYSWLEDVDSADTKAWVESENRLTFAYLSAIPGRDKIAERYKGLLNYERFTLPQREGNRYFYSRNDGLQNQNVLYVADSLRGRPRVLIDPNKLSKDGTVALSGSAVTEDGKLMAYSISVAGSDWQEWHVKNVDTGEDTKDLISWSKFSGASWAKDGSGFYYSRYEEPKGNIMKEADYYQKLYFHKLGTHQRRDELIYERRDQKEWGFDGRATDDGHYLVIIVWHGTAHENRIFYKDLLKPDSKVVELLPNADAEYVFMDNVGPVFYFKTDKRASRGRVMSLNVEKGDANSLEIVVPEAEETLEGASAVGHKIFASYLKDAHALVRVYDLKGKHVSDVELPGLGSVDGFGGHLKDKETFFSYTSYTSPATIYRYDLKKGNSTVFRKPKVKFDASRYETVEVFVASKDGTKIPVFITARKGIKLDGSNPTLIYGYGGFSIAEKPAFSSSRAVWLDMGGVYADVVLRGGSEYGESWHAAGKMHNKQNVFDDFISAAEWLTRERYTSPPKLACQGASNGGLLIGAMITQRPDLWGATLPAVGVMDMLRFNKFTIGYAWMQEYGDPDKAEDFPYIYKYSPLHNIKPGVKYPPTLVTTADHDDRVFPAHSFKFATALQAAQAGNAPVLIRVETRAGHGAGKPISKIIEEVADEWAFLLKNLKMTLPDHLG